MGKQYTALTDADIDFIRTQKLFYIASVSEAEINLSPRGYDTIYVEDASTLYLLDLPGSGNRTGRDAKAGGKFTLLFNAFEGDARILRLFCRAELIEKYEDAFEAPFKHFNIQRAAVRRLFKFTIQSVESSCGMSLPFMRFESARNELLDWANDMAQSGDLKSYIESHETPPEILY